MLLYFTVHVAILCLAEIARKLRFLGGFVLENEEYLDVFVEGASLFLHPTTFASSSIEDKISK